MNFYIARVPLTSQRPRYTRATRKLYVAHRQVISIVKVHREGLMQSSRSSPFAGFAPTMLKWKREHKAEERVNLPDRKQATRRYIRPQRAFRSRSLTLACRQIEREDIPRLREASAISRGLRDGGMKPLGKKSVPTCVIKEKDTKRKRNAERLKKENKTTRYRNKKACWSFTAYNIVILSHKQIYIR